MTFDEIRFTCERATDGDWRDRPLESIGGYLLMRGIPQNMAQSLLDTIGDVRLDHMRAPYVRKAYELAKRALPEAVNGRLEAALDMALYGKVTVEGTIATVRDQAKTFTVDGFNCNCGDAEAPFLGQHRLCSHKLAYWLFRRALELMSDPAEL